MSTTGYINVSMEIFGGLLSLIFIFCLFITHRQKALMERRYIRLLICNTILLFSDATAWIFKGRLDGFSFYAVRISNFLVFTLGYLMLVLFTHYLIGFWEAKGVCISKNPLYVICALMLFAACLTILSQFNGMYYRIDSQNIYHRQDWFWLSQTFGVFGMILNGGVIFRCRKAFNRKELWSFSIYVCLPAAALLLQIMFYGIAVLYLATTVCLLGMFISVQMELYQEVSRKELEIERARTAVMLSQIQPHFLYNSLSSIKLLCDIDPPRASVALEHFAFYLRGNLDSLNDLQLVPFEKELGHIKDYLYLEKMRFAEKLNIRWELLYEDFLLPPLTVQPVVENAIRHGINKKKGGGTLTIRCERVESNVVITIHDDGVGFDPTEKKADGRSHIGIENTRERLKSLCGATLSIESMKGGGTTVKMVLPQKEGMK